MTADFEAFHALLNAFADWEAQTRAWEAVRVPRLPLVDSREREEDYERYLVRSIARQNATTALLAAVGAARPALEAVLSGRGPCAVHAGLVHGGEAEELRQGIEKAIADYDEHDPAGAVTRQLAKLLHNIDARDSLAHLEARDA